MLTWLKHTTELPHAFPDAQACLVNKLAFATLVVAVMVALVDLM
jgi:hypothetical protein